MLVEQLVVLASLAATSVVPLPVRQPDSERPIEVPYCELVQKPEAYEGRLIKTSAVLMTDNRELLVLADPQCRGGGENDNWAELRIADALGSNEITLTLERLLKDDGAAAVTVVGYFAGPRKTTALPAWIKDREIAERWTLMMSRYGHMHQYRFLFQVREVSAVAAANLDSL